MWTLRYRTPVLLVHFLWRIRLVGSRGFNLLSRCIRTERSLPCSRTQFGPMILVGGGSGMAPLLSILTDLVESGEQRCVRFFYGARTRRDLFMLNKIQELGSR